MKIGIFRFNKKSVSAKLGPVTVNSKGKVSIKKGMFTLSFKIPMVVIFLTLTYLIVNYCI